MIKKGLEKNQEINIGTYLKKKKFKKENMEKTYHNMSEEKKQKLKEYQKNCHETKKIIRYTIKINNELNCML